jgi:prepilin-type N-terminal cleavage/methylation domain-containing protein
MNFKRSKGFTLIELLVVVAIISLLTSVVLASLQDAKDKANESKMIQTIKQAQNSLELFKTNTGRYPNGYFQIYPDGNGGTIYGEYFGDDPNYTEINQSPYLNFQDAFQRLKITDDTYIWYADSKIMYEWWEMAFTCDSGNSQTLETLASNGSYTILVQYPSSYSLFRKIREGYVVDGGGTYLAEGYWFSYPTACFSI